MNNNEEQNEWYKEDDFEKDFEELQDQLDDDVEIIDEIDGFEETAENKKMFKKSKKGINAYESVALSDENKDLKDQILRKTAEFENFKKRTLKEKEEMGIYAKGVCVKELLTPIDNFERALSTQCKDPEFQKGMEMILSQFEKSLQALGVVEIEAYDMPFDPELHNAIQQVDNPEFGDNTVCQVMQKGYIMGDKVIRHAMVTVANP